MHATGPASELTNELATLGPSVGSGHVDWYASRSDRPDAVGELHFGGVLGGRAIEDVWIPAPGQPGANQPPSAFHGSTLRFYEPKLGA